MHYHHNIVLYNQDAEHNVAMKICKPIFCNIVIISCILRKSDKKLIGLIHSIKHLQGIKEEIPTVPPKFFFLFLAIDFI